MNKTEAAYRDQLELRKRCGEIQDYGFERITLKLAKDTRYTPDFDVLLNDGSILLVDTKGAKKVARKDGSTEIVAYSQEDSKMKVKVAADMFYFRFIFTWFNKQTGCWDEQEF